MKRVEENMSLEIADYITDFDNNHDGAAKAIEKFINQ